MLEYGHGPREARAGPQTRASAPPRERAPPRRVAPALRARRRRLVRDRDADPGPARRPGFEPAAVVSAKGLSAEGARRKFGFEIGRAAGSTSCSRPDDLDLIVIATPHDTHAGLAAGALEAGPRRLRREAARAQLGRARARRRGAARHRRAAVRRLQPPLRAAGRPSCAPCPGPRLMTYRVNAGRLAPSHWTNDLARGGGRLKGEGCHFIDFLCDQAGADPLTVRGARLPLAPGAAARGDRQLQRADLVRRRQRRHVDYAADSPDRARQGAVRDHGARRLRGDRRLPQRDALEPGAEAARSRAARTRASRPSTRRSPRSCAGRGRQPAPEGVARLDPGDAGRRALARDRAGGAGRDAGGGTGRTELAR